MSDSRGGGKNNGGWRGRGRATGRWNNWRGSGHGGWRGSNSWNRGGRTSENSILNSSMESSSSNQSHMESFYPSVPCPYLAWKQYLPNTPYSDCSPFIPLINAATVFLKKDPSTVSKDILFEKRYFLLDLEKLQSDKELNEDWPSLIEEIENLSERVCGLFGLAMHHMISSDNVSVDQESHYTNTFPIVRARFVNHSVLTQLKQLKSSYFQRLVTVQGTVVRVSPIKPSNTWLAWQCPACNAEVVTFQPEGKFTTPSKCSGGCKSVRNFVPLRSSKSTVCVDRQVIRLQEVLDDEAGEGGRVPRTVDCELTEDLCDSCQPGDVVRLTGVVKVVSSEEASGKKSKNKSMYLLYISAQGITNPKSKGSRTANIGIEFTYNDYALVQEVHSSGDQILKLLVHSLCPSIYGHDLVKVGLLLGLFGGTTKNQNAALPVRGDPHILVVGDPGLGKSQMLTSACNVAPRGVFVTGNTTTTSGLTVTLTRESGNDFSLEAGALVLADQGCCCIDEFDKMSGQHSALLEAMEQQSISVAKAGVVCTMPARTAVLAAANPVGGHYNKGKTVAENLKLGPALLSRFDLVFILIDRPDETQDSLLSEHVMSLHSKDFTTPTTSKPTTNAPLFTNCLRPTTASQVAGQSLADRLVKCPDEQLDPLPSVCLKKYIAYARRYVFPRLTSPAAKVLQSFYLELRAQHQTADCTPITTRQLESMIRLTEARAKLELREEASEQDALDVVEVMKSCMVDTFSDQIGILDFSRSQMGSGMSSRGSAKKFIQALQRQADRLQKNIFTVDEMKTIANMAKISVPNFMDFIFSLNNQGYLIKKTPKIYQLLTADY